MPWTQLGYIYIPLNLAIMTQRLQRPPITNRQCISHGIIHIFIPKSSNSINHGHQEVPVRFTTFLRLFKLKENFLDAQIGPLVHEAKVRKWLNFQKISVRPPWSIFIITQKPKIIFTSNQSHWKSNKIIYSFYVYTKDQFCTYQ